MRKIVFTALFFVFCFLSAEDDTQIFAAQLYNQAAVLLENSKVRCGELRQKNKTLADSISNLHKTAREHQNVATNVFANAEYLLNVLQENIEKTCGLVKIADGESIRLIIADEFGLLREKHKISRNFEDFIDKIFGTEYAKLLYLATSVSSFEKMYTKWAVKMISEKNDTKKTLVNIGDANTELKKELTDFIKTFKFYYEKTTK